MVPCSIDSNLPKATLHMMINRYFKKKKTVIVIVIRFYYCSVGDNTSIPFAGSEVFVDLSCK